MKPKLLIATIILSVFVLGPAISYGQNCGPCGDPVCSPCDPCATCCKSCDLFGGLKDLFKSKPKCGPCGPAVCEPICAPCEPVACDPCTPVEVCEPVACEPCEPVVCDPCEPVACDPCAPVVCDPCAPCKPRLTLPKLNLLQRLEGLFPCHSCNACSPCVVDCCGPSCGPVGCTTCAGGDMVVEPAANTPAPEKAQPLPKAPGT
jgi:hypothetical protein